MLQGARTIRWVADSFDKVAARHVTVGVGRGAERIVRCHRAATHIAGSTERRAHGRCVSMAKEATRARDERTRASVSISVASLSRRGGTHRYAGGGAQSFHGRCVLGVGQIGSTRSLHRGEISAYNGCEDSHAPLARMCA